MLYKDEYTSGNDVRIDPTDPNTVYATLWQQQQSFIEGGAFGTSGETAASSSPPTAARRGSRSTDGLPGSRPGQPRHRAEQPESALRDGGAGARRPAAAGAAARAAAAVGLLQVHRRRRALVPATCARAERHRHAAPDNRPLARIGGGDLPTIVVDPKNANVVYSCSTVFWRTEDGGLTWSAVRGAPGGDDYQKAWINPNNPDILLVVSDQGAVVSANRGASWSNWYTQPTAAMYHVTTDNAFPYRVCSGQQDSGSACVDSRGNDGEITFHDWHPVNIQEYGEAAPDPKNPDMVYGSARNSVSLFNRMTGQTTNVDRSRTCTGRLRAQRAHDADRVVAHRTGRRCSTRNAAVFKTSDGGTNWTRISGDLARPTWEVPANAGKYASTVTPAPAGSITALSPSPRDINVLWAGTDDGVIQVTMDGGANVDERDAAGRQAVDAHLQHRGGALRHADGVRRGEHAAPRRPESALRAHARRRKDVDARSTRASPRAPRVNSIREDPAQEGPALRRERHAGVGLVRRRRPLGVAPAEHAGDLGARPRR